MTITAIEQAIDRRNEILRELASANAELDRLQAVNVDSSGLLPLAEQTPPDGMVRCRCNVCGSETFARAADAVEGRRRGILSTASLRDDPETPPVLCPHCYVSRGVAILRHNGWVTGEGTARFKMVDFPDARFDGGPLVCTKTVTCIEATRFRPLFRAALAEHFDKQPPGESRLVWTQTPISLTTDSSRPWERDDWSGELLTIATATRNSHAAHPDRVHPITLVRSSRDQYVCPNHLL